MFRPCRISIRDSNLSRQIKLIFVWPTIVLNGLSTFGCFRPRILPKLLTEEASKIDSSDYLISFSKGLVLFTLLIFMFFKDPTISSLETSEQALRI